MAAMVSGIEAAAWTNRAWPSLTRASLSIAERDGFFGQPRLAHFRDQCRRGRSIVSIPVLARNEAAREKARIALTSSLAGYGGIAGVAPVMVRPKRR